MIIYLITGAIVLLFAYLSKLRNNNYGLFSAFIIIFLFLSFRYNYGNDYKGYLDLFYDINSNFKLYIGGSYKTEIGWVFLNRIFHPFGFFSMIIFLALINCIAYYKFITKFVEKKYYWFAVLIYYFNSNFLLIQLSAMRQCLAIVLFIFSLDYIINKKYIKSFALLLLASSFHYSSFFTIPIIFISLLINLKIKLFHIAILVVLFVYLFAFGNLFKSQFMLISSLIFGDQYLQYQNLDISKPNLVNILTYSVTIIFILKYYNNFNSYYKFFVKLLIIGILIIPIGFILPLASRLALYFLPLSIIVYPKLIELIEFKLIKKLFIFGVISVILIRLITFFLSSIYGPYYSNYSTIFEALL